MVLDVGRSSGERGDVEADLTDLRTLLHEAGAQRPYLAGAIVGGAIYASFAARHPEVVSGVIWYGACAQLARTPDYPWGATADQLEAYARRIEEGWGTDPFAEQFVAAAAPSMAGDREATDFFAHWMRQTSDPAAVAANVRLWAGIDLHPMLASLRVPALMLVRGDDPAESAYVAARIAGRSWWRSMARTSSRSTAAARSLPRSGSSLPVPAERPRRSGASSR